MKAAFDAIVIGAGVGGMCAAALLADRGHAVLLVEKRRYLGGRFSTVDHRGFRCSVGGLAVPVGHSLEQVCGEIGIDAGVRPARTAGLWLGGRTFDLAQGGTRAVIGQVTEDSAEAARICGALRQARFSPPDEDVSFRAWLDRYTHNPLIHGIFQATIASLLTVNSNELPVGEYFRLMQAIAPLRFGFIEGGSLALWRRMADFIGQAGGKVLTGTIVREILVEKGRVRGARLGRRGKACVVRAPVVVSNVGPAGTAALVSAGQLEADYLARLRETITPTAILWLHFCSRERVLDYPALSVGCSRRVNMIDAPSYEAAGLAPPGWHLYTVGAAPPDSLRPGDVRQEFEAIRADLEEIIPDFDRRCRVLTKTCYRGKWPGFRTVPGRHAGHRTPVENLFNVGDACSPSGYEGTMGAARSAQIVADEIRAPARRSA